MRTAPFGSVPKRSLGYRIAGVPPAMSAKREPFLAAIPGTYPVPFRVYWCELVVRPVESKKTQPRNITNSHEETLLALRARCGRDARDPGSIAS
jgi:hypothetical protein